MRIPQAPEQENTFRGKQRPELPALSGGDPDLGQNIQPVDAILKLVIGRSLLAGAEPKECEREETRVTPAVYQVLKSHPDATTDPEGNYVDMFDRTKLQSAITCSCGRLRVLICLLLCSLARRNCNFAQRTVLIIKFGIARRITAE